MKPLHLTPTKSVLDRSAELRQNPAALEKLWDNGKILHISNQRVLVEGDSLKLLNANEITKLSTDFSKGNKIFLGVLDDVGFFAYCTDIKSELREGFDAGENPNYKTLRELDGKFNEFELAICVHAQALSNWHHAHPRCSRCGETTSPAHGGTIRICDSDGSEHFPRVDPAIIVLLR
ncbi:MAG: hypothetical protein RL129_761, partial [Actinomycetota bacterium]